MLSDASHWSLCLLERQPDLMSAWHLLTAWLKLIALARRLRRSSIGSRPSAMASAAALASSLAFTSEIPLSADPKPMARRRPLRFHMNTHDLPPPLATSRYSPAPSPWRPGLAVFTNAAVSWLILFIGFCPYLFPHL